MSQQWRAGDSLAVSPGCFTAWVSGIADPNRIKKTTSRRVIFTLYLHAAVAATGQCTTLSGMSGCLIFKLQLPKTDIDNQPVKLERVAGANS